MSLGPYASFIVTSYVLVTAVVLFLIVWIALDYRRQNAGCANSRPAASSGAPGAALRIHDERSRMHPARRRAVPG